MTLWRELDEKSGLVSLSPQVGWGELLQALFDAGWGLQRAALYPQRATLAELLTQRAPHNSPQHSGDLRHHVAGLSATLSDGARYEYPAAPRKASGPDLRHLFLGAGPQYGQLDEVVLQIYPKTPGRLIRWPVENGFVEALSAWRELLQMGLRPSWSWWQPGGALEVAFHAPLAWMAAQEVLLDGLLGQAPELMSWGEELIRRPAIEAALPPAGHERWGAHIDAASQAEAMGATLVGASFNSHLVRLFVGAQASAEMTQDDAQERQDG
jgi:hypothetical protein